MPIAAFFDWDGTLSADGQTVASDTVDAIHALQQGGNAAILCTGRATGLIPDTAKAIGFDGLVAAAGAFVRLGEKQLFRRYLPPEQIPALIAHFLADGQTCVLEGETQMYVLNDTAGRFPASWTPLASPEEFASRFPGHIVSKLTLHGPMSAATDALLSAISGRDEMPGLVKAAMDSAQANANRTRKTSYEQVCADSESAYAARNPHNKKEG